MATFLAEQLMLFIFFYDSSERSARCYGLPDGAQMLGSIEEPYW